MSFFELPYKQFKFYLILINFLIIIISILCLTFFFNSNSIYAIIKGLIAGSIASVINFKLMAKKVESVTASVTEGYKRSGAVLIKNYFFRYLILLVILIIAALNQEKINLIATIIGIFSIQITILFVFFIDSLIIKFKKAVKINE